MTLAATILSLALAVHAAPGAGANLRAAIDDFEFGDHAVAAQKLEKLVNPISLDSAEDIIVARQYLGACYYLLNQRPRAQGQFSMLLALDGSHKLDPEVFSPALVQFFEDVRTQTGIALKPKPKKAPPKPKTVVVTPPPPVGDPPPFGLAFVPFGVGQFNNQHPIRGALFAVAEVGLFATSLATGLMFQGIPKTTGPRGEAIFGSQDDADRAATLQSIWIATLWSGVGVMALGIVEALISYPGDATSSDAVVIAPTAVISDDGSVVGVALRF